MRLYGIMHIDVVISVPNLAGNLTPCENLSVMACHKLQQIKFLACQLNRHFLQEHFSLYGINNQVCTIKQSAVTRFSGFQIVV